MRVAIIAPGSRGDVEPYVALAKGLVDSGHLVRLVTHEDFETLVSSHGVEFWPFKGRVQEIAQGAAMRELLEKGSFFAVLRQMSKDARHGAVTLADGGLAACAGVDLVLAGIGGLFVGLALAEKLGLPLVQAYYIPFTPTRAYPSFLLRFPTWLGGVPNRLSYRLAQQAIWQGFRAADKVARQRVLGLPPAPILGPFSSDRMKQYPVLYGFSPHVIPKAPDWDERTHVTGYWFLERSAAWTPPPDLRAFLQAGPPPLFIGFGSMSSRNPEETAALILQALARTGQRAVMLSGWGGLRAAQVPDTVLMVDSVPYSWLFPRVAAVVHHGGAGTTAHGLRAGVPSVVIPFFGDQPFWGQRVFELGVGPEPIPRKKLTVERFADAIEQALNDEAMRQRAADLASQIQTEDGVARAVAVVRGMSQSLG